MPSDLHTFRSGPGQYLAFLGRISPEKRVELGHRHRPRRRDAAEDRGKS